MKRWHAEQPLMLRRWRERHRLMAYPRETWNRGWLASLAKWRRPKAERQAEAMLFALGRTTEWDGVAWTRASPGYFRKRWPIQRYRCRCCQAGRAEGKKLRRQLEEARRG